MKPADKARITRAEHLVEKWEKAYQLTKSSYCGNELIAARKKLKDVLEFTRIKYAGKQTEFSLNQ